MNVKELKEIFRLVEKTDFTEVEISQGDWRLRVERGKNQPSAYSAVVPVTSMPGASPSVPQAGSVSSEGATEGKASEKPIEAAKKNEFIVTSPFVGTFYSAPAPEADPYVKVGQRVTVGQSLCIVEAMKLMNELESDYDGIIEEIFVSNGTPVEYGEKLFRIIPG